MATNKDFQALIDEIPAGHSRPTAARRQSSTGILLKRTNALAEIASGTRVDRNQEFVDPSQCRIWKHHNRVYSDLNEENCHDLIDSLIAQGKQDIPAIVRRVRDQDGIDYEIICGARRHWSISWLKANNYPDFKLLVEVRHLTDEEAFRLSDLENRHRRDISDYERALDYRRAIDLFYDGNQRRMAERLKVNDAWMSRYLEIANLPSTILQAFGSPHRIGLKAASLIAPLLKRPETKERVLAQGELIAVEQQAAQEAGKDFAEPAVVTKRLVAAAAAQRAPTKATSSKFALEDVFTKNGKLLLKTEKVRGGGVRIIVQPKTGANRADLLEAITKVFEAFPENKILG
jgi:ParB family transcriptional regulator, chromosome partitioning protein